ncbi:estradiol 17-beta-dehydrogenase 11 [Drosophila serrata]|uniref:estradiol 17-beta-dehydrogenase 11 n=1 Tax=Drosophila serrata TaxID=7274 RepID=UPI000A1CF92E|nr:estradiol 17-beta-dehydrogenase 11 [Drosophila serrata]
MSVWNTLVKAQAHVSLIGLVAITPLIIVAAVLSNLFAKLSRCCSSPKSIAGQVAVVTGGGHGLGRAISLELAKKGCHIAVVDINLTGAESTVKEIKQCYDVQAKPYKVDVTSIEQLVELNKKVVVDLGPVTVLVNNAGVLLHRNCINPDPAEVQLMIDVNLSSHFWTKSVFLPKMKELRRGHILSISSLGGIFPLPYSSTYSATKAGVAYHMRSLRMELFMEKQKDIHVTTVFPTFLTTNDEVTDMSGQVGIGQLYPLISGQEMAKRSVEGMMRGEQEVLLPGLAALMYRLVNLMPSSWQMLGLVLITGSRFRKFRDMRS